MEYEALFDDLYGQSFSNEYFIPSFKSYKPKRKGYGSHSGAVPGRYRHTERDTYGKGNNATYIPYGLGCQYHNNCFNCHLPKDKCPTFAIYQCSELDHAVLPYNVGD